LRSWTYNIFPVPTMQPLMSCQQRPPRGLRCPKDSLSGDCSDLQPGLPNQVKGARPAPQSYAVLMTLFSWSPPRIIGVTGYSVNPGAQDSDA
jgi:hypothetical protein